MMRLLTRGFILPLRARAGFTLPELLLAAAILAFALSGILLLFINCIFLNESNRNLTTAITHAQFVLEEIKNTTFNNIATNINAGTWDLNSAGITAKGLIPLSNESIDASVSGTTLLDVTIPVSWRDFGTRDRNFTLRTLIAEP